MRKTILIVFFSVIWLTDFCQTNVYHPFPDSNAIWIQNSDGWYGTACWIYHYQNLYISGDTLLSGHSYHKLYLNEYVSEFCAPPNTPFPPFYSFGQYYGANYICLIINIMLSRNIDKQIPLPVCHKNKEAAANSRLLCFIIRF